MATIAEIAKRSQDYINSLPANINRVVIFVEPAILDLNRKQLIEKQIDAFGNLMPEYSEGWKKKKSLTNWNLKSSGATQNSLQLFSDYPKQYLITPKDKRNMNKLIKRGFETENYFGIAPENRPKAQEITGTAIATDYMNAVFKS